MSRSPSVTAYVASGAEAYVAWMHERRHQGLLHDRTSIAEIWHTSDHGHTWRPLPWRRAVRVFMSRAATATWPPEYVNRMWLDGRELSIEIRDDWGWDSPWDPIWSATWTRDRWRVRFERLYRSEVDGPIVPAALELRLPGLTMPPDLGPFR